MASILAPLDPLLRQSAKRTRDIFASCPDDSLKDGDEKRSAVPLLPRIPHSLDIVPAYISPSKWPTSTNTTVSSRLPSFLNKPPSGPHAPNHPRPPKNCSPLAVRRPHP